MSQNIRKSLTYVMCMIAIGTSYSMVKNIQNESMNNSFTIVKYGTMKDTVKVSYVKKTS